MTIAELKNQTLVAAEAARQMGFENTHAALVEIVQSLKEAEFVGRSPSDVSTT